MNKKLFERSSNSKVIDMSRQDGRSPKRGRQDPVKKKKLHQN